MTSRRCHREGKPTGRRLLVPNAVRPRVRSVRNARCARPHPVPIGNIVSRSNPPRRTTARIHSAREFIHSLGSAGKWHVRRCRRSLATRVPLTRSNSDVLWLSHPRSAQRQVTCSSRDGKYRGPRARHSRGRRDRLLRTRRSSGGKWLIRRLRLSQGHQHPTTPNRRGKYRGHPSPPVLRPAKCHVPRRAMEATGCDRTETYLQRTSRKH